MTDAATPTKVLFVEDEPELQRAYGRYFRDRYDVSFASTGAEVLPQMEKFGPDVVVLDMHLPDTDGIEIMRRLRDVRPGIPVVITTAYVSVEPMVDVLGLGHQGYLLKPFSMEALATLIDDAV
jgi:two-component system OmpR family response regulator